MELIDICIDKSPERSGFIRLAGEILFEKKNVKRTYWIEFPSEYRKEISEDGNCWLMLMNAFAALNGEDVRITQSVDPYLLENLKALRREWRAVDKRWKITKYNCPCLYSLDRGGDRTGMFFSGGVDSFYSLLRNNIEPNNEGDASGAITDLITVWGFEIGLDLPGEFERMNKHIKTAAQVFGKNHIVAITNIKSFGDDFDDLWIPVGHSGALGFVAYALRRRFREIVIGSSIPYGDIKPHGTHSLTDGLMSSKALRILHDGAIANRSAKVKRVAANAEAMNILHVCLRKDEGEDGASRHLNCSRCEKCVLTMAGLDLAGKKGEAASFDWSKYSVGSLERQLIIDGPLYPLWKELRETAKLQFRPDIAEAVAKAVRRSRPFWFLSKTEYWMKKRFPFIMRNKRKFQKIKRTFYALVGMRA